MIITSYGDAQLDAKIDELAKLDKKNYSGQIVSTGDKSDLVVRNKNKVQNLICHSNSPLSKTIEFVKRFFEENSSRLRSPNLPSLDRIAHFMSANGDRSIAQIFDTLYKANTQLSTFPPEVLLQIATTTESFISLRSTCSSLHTLLKQDCHPLPYANIVDASFSARGICRLVKKNQLEPINYLIKQFLSKASAENQKFFWNCFTAKDFESITALLTTPFDTVTTLAFENAICIEKRAICVAHLINSCPNIQNLKILEHGEGTLPELLLAAIVNAPQLKELDIGLFILEEPKNILKLLFYATKLRELHLSINYSSEIQDCLETHALKFKKLFLKFPDETTVPGDAIKSLFDKCSNLRGITINRLDLLPYVPNTIEDLTIFLPPDNRHTDLLLWLQTTNLPNLKSLTITTKYPTDIRLLDLLRLLRKIPTLKRLSCPQFELENPKKEIPLLASLCKQLSSLELSVNPKRFDEIDTPHLVNSESNLTELIIHTFIVESINNFKLLDELFCACNPQKLIFDARSINDINDVLVHAPWFKLADTAEGDVAIRILRSAYRFPKESRLEILVLENKDLYDVDPLKKIQGHIMKQVNSFDKVSYNFGILLK